MLVNLQESLTLFCRNFVYILSIWKSFHIIWEKKLCRYSGKLEIVWQTFQMFWKTIIALNSLQSLEMPKFDLHFLYGFVMILLIEGGGWGVFAKKM